MKCAKIVVSDPDVGHKHLLRPPKAASTTIMPRSAPEALPGDPGESANRAVAAGLTTFFNKQANGLTVNGMTNAPRSFNIQMLIYKVQK